MFADEIQKRRHKLPGEVPQQTSRDWWRHWKLYPNTFLLFNGGQGARCGFTVGKHFVTAALRDTRAVGRGMQSNPNIDYDFFDEDDKGGTSNVRPKSSASPGRRASNTRNTDSEEPDRSVVRIEATVPQVARSSDNYSENFESDEEDGGNSTRRSKSEESTKKDGDDDSESDGESKQAQTRAGRPKTGVRNRRERLSNGDSDNKGSNDDDGSSSGTITDSDTNSDSDITDVSPLNSPSSPKSSRRRIEFGDTTTLGDARPKSGRPQSGKSSRSNYQQLLQPNRDTMNLKLLMQAISEMESDGPGRTKTAKRSSFSGRTTRQYVAPADRRNYSFRNNQIRDIDKENQRLMQQIMTYSTAVKKQKVKKAAPVTPEKNRPTTSAVNRMKEQRRIEEENRVSPT